MKKITDKMRLDFLENIDAGLDPWVIDHDRIPFRYEGDSEGDFGIKKYIRLRNAIDAAIKQGER